MSHFPFSGSGTHPPTGGTEASSQGQLRERGHGWLVWPLCHIESWPSDVHLQAHWQHRLTQVGRVIWGTKKCLMVQVVQVLDVSIMCHFTLFCIWEIGLFTVLWMFMSVMITWGHSQLPYKSRCQSSCPCVCPVHQVIVHEVPGQELEVEVYDKDPDQDDFLGRYICIFMSLVCLCWILHCHLSSVNFHDQSEKVLFQYPFKAYKLLFLKFQYVFSMLWTFYFLHLLFLFISVFLHIGPNWIWALWRSPSLSMM